MDGTLEIQPGARAVEAWLALVSSAMKGTVEAQEALKSLASAATSQAELSRWVTRFLPGIGTGPDAVAFGSWLEDWWKAMGVVPRSRYLELLEKYEETRRRLDQAEQTIRGLQAAISAGQDATRLIDQWQALFTESLQAQSNWLRSWSPTEKREESIEE